MNELEQIRVNPTEESSVWIETCFMNLKNYGRIILDNRIPRCLVRMDKLRMEQVIDNVVGNSHKYAGTDIHVSFDETRDASNTFIRVRISDSGPGVDEDELPLITEKYYRGTAAKDKSGYGVGMYLVKSYMEMQGGGMEYYNDKGFVVELYVKKV
jgi:signal transduction histidine kinase